MHLDNFFELRDHYDAEPHIRVLARAMREEAALAQKTFRLMGQWGMKRTTYQGRIFQNLLPGEWHLPFVTPEDGLKDATTVAKKVSAARCARVSYFLPDTGKLSDALRDLELCNRLAESRPIHASPFEHQATPLPPGEKSEGNFRGWRQYRREIEEALAA